MIEISKLTKIFKNHLVLDDISVRFEKGHIYGLIGPNGCGKTTLMRIICGFSHPTKGSVRIDGKLIGHDCDFAPSTGIIIESPGFLPQYSAKQNMKILAKVSNDGTKHDIGRLIQLVGLDPNDNKPISKYSLGMKQRLGIAQALIGDPSILILDEPFNGLDQNSQNSIHELLQQQKALGKVIILASHNHADISKACDAVYEMRAGKLHLLVDTHPTHSFPRQPT